MTTHIATPNIIIIISANQHPKNKIRMASVGSFHTLSLTNSSRSAAGYHSFSSFPSDSTFLGSKVLSRKSSEEEKKKKRGALAVVAAVGELSSDSTTYLIAGAAAVALVGTAFPILFSRKDTCPECDGAGFVRKSDVTLRANAARKDQTQIVCANCNGLGKLNQVDK